MQTEITSFWEWQQHFSDESTCLQAIIKQRWPEGVFVVQIAIMIVAGYSRHVMSLNLHTYHQHTSKTADSLFHNTKLPFSEMVLVYLFAIFI